MRRFYVFLGRHTPEVWALTSSIAILGVGGYWAWTGEAIWLNRAGTLVIIVGILLGASRFHEWVQDQGMRFLEANFDQLMQRVVASNEAPTDAMPAHELERVKANVLSEVRRDFSEVFEGDKRRLRAWEVFLVIVGTFLNGLGDYVVVLLKGT